eukprot:gene8241-829_t
MSKRRFPVETAGVPATKDAKWALTKNLHLSFHNLVESLAPLVEQCQKRCMITKQAGRIDAFKVMAARIRSLPLTVIVTFPLLSVMSRELLEMEEQAAYASDDEVYPHAPSIPTTAFRAHNKDREIVRNNFGWDFVDETLQDQEFLKARLTLAEFNKMRAKEIRLAYVCGYRDALKQLLEWFRQEQSRDKTEPVSRELLQTYLLTSLSNESHQHEDDHELTILSSQLTQGSKLSDSCYSHRLDDENPFYHHSHSFAQFLRFRQQGDAKCIRNPWTISKRASKSLLYGFEDGSKKREPRCDTDVDEDSDLDMDLEQGSTGCSIRKQSNNTSASPTSLCTPVKARLPKKVRKIPKSFKKHQ